MTSAVDGPDRDLHSPEGGRPSALAVVLHPHPAMGGDRHHPLMVALAERLSTAEVAVLRLDLPDPDVAAAAAQLTAAADQARGELELDRLVLVGYSWGSVVSAAAKPDGLVGRALVAPPVGTMHLARPDQLPLLALAPAHDQFGPPDAVQAALFGDQSALVEVVEGCDHFLVGAIDRIASRVTEWITDLL